MTTANAFTSVVLAALLGAGCGRRAANASGSTNSTAGAEAATNYLLSDNPVAGLTNPPAITNILSTNHPALTNR